MAFLLLASIASRSIAIDLKCLKSGNLTCVVEDLRITNHNQNIKKVQNDDNVKFVEFFVYDKTVNFLPSNLGESFPFLESVKVQRSKLKEITSKDFKIAKKLKVLNFWNNDLQRIERNTFDDLLLLEEIDLSENNLNELHTKLFRKLLNLKTLNLDSNNLAKIDVNLFRSNLNLKSLSLQENSLIELPIYVFKNLKQLEHLNVNYNEITSLQDHIFDDNELLMELFVADNAITAVGMNNIARIETMKKHNFLYNPCTESLKKGYNTKDLAKVLKENCAANDKTTISWLRGEVEQIKRFKRENDEKLECSEQEIVQSIAVVNFTREFLDVKIGGIKDELLKLSTSIADVKALPAPDLSQIPELVKTKLHDDFNTVTMKLSSMDSKINAIKTVADDVQQVINEFKTDMKLKDNFMNLTNKVEAALNATKDVQVSLKGHTTSIRTEMEKVINKDNNLFKEAVELIVNKARCDFYKLSYKFMEEVSANIEADKLEDLFTKLKEIKDALNKSEVTVSFDNFKTGTDNQKALDSFKENLNSDCSLTATLT